MEQDDSNRTLVAILRGEKSQAERLSSVASPASIFPFSLFLIRPWISKGCPLTRPGHLVHVITPQLQWLVLRVVALAINNRPPSNQSKENSRFVVDKEEEKVFLFLCEGESLYPWITRSPLLTMRTKPVQIGGQSWDSQKSLIHELLLHDLRSCEQIPVWIAFS